MCLFNSVLLLLWCCQICCFLETCHFAAFCHSCPYLFHHLGTFSAIFLCCQPAIHSVDAGLPIEMQGIMGAGKLKNNQPQYWKQTKDLWVKLLVINQLQITASGNICQWIHRGPTTHVDTNLFEINEYLQVLHCKVLLLISKWDLVDLALMVIPL